MLIYLPSVFFLLLLVYSILKNRGIGIDTFLIMLYFFSALFSILIYNINFLQYKNINIRLDATLFYCFFLFLFFLPIMNIRKEVIISPVINIRIVDKVLNFLIVVNLVGIIFSIKYVFFVLTHDPGDFKTMGGMDAVTKELNYSFNIFERIGFYILGIFSDFYIIIVVLFFYSVCFLKKKFRYNILLLIASTSTVINGMRVGGRTQLIYWLIIFISCFLFFKKAIPQDVKKRIEKLFLLLLLLFTIYFSSVTISRFKDVNSAKTEAAEWLSIAVYFGQSYLNFADYWDRYDNKHYTLARILPITYDLVSTEKFDSLKYRNSFPMDIGVFSTFLGDLYLDIGIWGIVLYSFLFLFLVSLTQKHKMSGKYSLSQIVIFFLLYQIPANGLFYYSIWNKTTTLGIIGSILICILIKQKRNDRSIFYNCKL